MSSGDRQEQKVAIIAEQEVTEDDGHTKHLVKHDGALSAQICQLKQYLQELNTVVRMQEDERKASKADIVRLADEMQKMKDDVLSEKQEEIKALTAAQRQQDELEIASVQKKQKEIDELKAAQRRKDEFQTTSIREKQKEIDELKAAQRRNDEFQTTSIREKQKEIDELKAAQRRNDEFQTTSIREKQKEIDELKAKLHENDEQNSSAIVVLEKKLQTVMDALEQTAKENDELKKKPPHIIGGIVEIPDEDDDGSIYTVQSHAPLPKSRKKQESSLSTVREDTDYDDRSIYTVQSHAPLLPSKKRRLLFKKR